MQRLTRYARPYPTSLGRPPLPAFSSVLWQPMRACSSSTPSSAVSAQINEMFDSFAESRELIRDAMESAGTVYFHEDMEDAITMTEQTLKQWSAIQEELKQAGDEALLSRLVKENDLKMKQLSAELEEAKHAGGE